jgi:hypothetical protein
MKGMTFIETFFFISLMIGIAFPPVLVIPAVILVVGCLASALGLY